VKWSSTRNSTRQGRMCHLISGCWSIDEVVPIVYLWKEKKTDEGWKDHEMWLTHLHLVHVVSDLLAILIF
jgi:hypothetical protein